MSLIMNMKTRLHLGTRCNGMICICNEN